VELEESERREGPPQSGLLLRTKSGGKLSNTIGKDTRKEKLEKRAGGRIRKKTTGGMKCETKGKGNYAGTSQPVTGLDGGGNEAGRKGQRV